MATYDNWLKRLAQWVLKEELDFARWQYLQLLEQWSCEKARADRYYTRLREIRDESK